MSTKFTVLVFAAVISVGYGFGIRDIWDFLLGAGYGQYPGGYPGQYPGGYPGHYPGGYPGHYPGGYPDGPPGAHHGCPLCDSSVYSYCSHKQAHDSCCCDNSFYNAFTCRRVDCKLMYANSCKEYDLISNCCCIDVERKVPPQAPIVAPVPVIAPVVV